MRSVRLTGDWDQKWEKLTVITLRSLLAMFTNGVPNDAIGLEPADLRERNLNFARSFGTTGSAYSGAP